jgi:hypothetical protein
MGLLLNADRSQLDEALQAFADMFAADALFPSREDGPRNESDANAQIDRAQTNYLV